MVRGIKAVLPADNNRNLTKSEINERIRGMANYGQRKWVMPRTLYGNSAAQKIWHWIVKLYAESDIAVFSCADEKTMERYCLAYAEYYKCLAAKKQLEDAYGTDYVGYYEALARTKLERLEADKMRILLSLEQALLLYPQAKIHTKSIPRVREGAKSENPADEFDV